jgi:glutathione S-transferase
VPVINDGGTVVADSFAIARYLDETYPSRPLMGDEAMVAACRLIEGWANQALGPLIMRMIVMRIYQSLGEADQPYFRETREPRFGRKLEEHWTGIDANKDAFRIALQPARATLAENKWLGGSEPRYADCILFGSLMWLTVFAGALPLAEDDAVTDWFERCRDLYDGFARDAKLAKEV